MKDTQKREKRNVPQFTPPEPQIIEKVRNQENTISSVEIVGMLDIDKDRFKSFLSDYLYEINFPIECSLKRIKYLNTPNLYSITLPPSLTRIESNSLKKCFFLEKISFLKDENGFNNLTYIGDHAFENTIIESITIPENVEKIGSFAFPPTLKQIDFDKGCPHLNYIEDDTFSNTQIESFKIPMNCRFHHKKCFFSGWKKLRNVIFDFYLNKDDPIFSESCGYSDNLLSNSKIEKFEVFISFITNLTFDNTPNLIEISVPKNDKSQYIKHDGCLFTKDKTNIIVAERNIKCVKICSECTDIRSFAFNIPSLEKVSFNENSNLLRIYPYAFYGSQIEYIKIPDCVKEIYDGVFAFCTKLEFANIPRSIDSLFSFTFSFTNLKEILIPNNVKYIYYYCFFNCPQLQTIKFEKNSILKEIDGFAFANTKIKSISIPSSVEQIDDWCFANCHDLKTIELDDSQSNLTKIGIECFIDTQIESIQLPQKIKKFDFSYTNVTNVSFNKFSSFETLGNFKSSKINQIFIPASVKEICSHAFNDCTNLTLVKIVDLQNSKLETISDYAFTNCINMTDFEISEKVKSIGLFAFKNCAKFMAKIKLNNNDSEIIIHGSSFENCGIVSFESKNQSIKVDDFAFKDCKQLINFSSITKDELVLGYSAFINCNNLKTINLSQNSKVVKFGKCCFMNSSIQKLEIPQNLKKIPKFCFKNCTKLSNLIINENSEITKFGTEAFSNSGLKSIFIPYKSELIKKNCFSECKSLKSLNISNDLHNCKLYEKAFYKSGIEQLNIPNGINEIGISCFKQCENLKQVSFSENTNITEIKDKVFKSSGIEILTTSASIEFIRNSAFEGCKKLKKVNLLSYTVYISPYAFADCIDLQEIKYNFFLSIQLIIEYQFPKHDTFTINFICEEIEKEMIEPLFVSKEPLFEKNIINNFYVINDKWHSRKALCNKITSIKDYTMKNYCAFEKVGCGYYTNQRKDLLTCDYISESINIAKETEMIHLCAFNYSQLKVINFEANSNLKIIDNFAFENLQIEEISFPNSLKIIGNYAFNHCHLLKKVNINSKSKLESIGKYAFCGTAIESIFFPSTLRKVESYSFFECFMLNLVDNHSNEIKFKEGSFSLSAVDNIKFPQKTIFGKSSFEKCYKLKHLKFLEEPKKVIFKENCFAFSGLEEIKIKYDAEIENYAFSHCSSLKKVIFTGSNPKIMSKSFDSSNIEFFVFDVNIKTSKQNIIENNQYFPESIEKVSIQHTIYNEVTNNTHKQNFFLNHKCYTNNGILFYANMINNQLLFEKQTNEKEDIKKNEILRVPSNVTKLDFPCMSHIKRINWGANGMVNDLGSPGFFSYYNLTQIVIPKLVKIIPSNLFEHCHYLSMVDFEKGSELEDIGDFSFANTKILQIVLPNTLKKIGKSAFCNNKYLNEVVFNGEFIGDSAFLNTGIKSFKLSNNTKFIGSRAFQYCHSLTTFDIDIQNSKLSEIGKYAFSESSINEISIPSEIKVIKKFTFNGCENLKKVIFSSNSKLKSINDHSFSCNLSLEKINLPKTITKISFKAFINTPSLKSIMEESNQFYYIMNNHEIYSNDNNLIFVPRNIKTFEIINKCSIIHSSSFCGPNLLKVIFPSNSLLEIEQLAFAHCTSLNEITIPKSVEKIGNECFIDCQNLEKVDFEPQSKIKEIPKFCFAFSGLQSIKLPESIEIIHHSSFLYCQNLKNINLYNTNVNYIGDYAFSETNIEVVKFPSSLQYIGNYSFGGNKSLIKIDFSEVEKVEDFNCQTKKQLKELLLNKKSKKAIIKENKLNKNDILFHEQNKNEKVISENDLDQIALPKNDQINSSSSNSKLTFQKPIIFKPTSKSQINNSAIISSSDSSNVIDNIKLTSQLSNQSLHISIKPNILSDFKQEISNKENDTINELQETIQKLKEENLKQENIIKNHEETIKRQEKIIKEQEEIIRKLKGSLSNQDEMPKIENKKADENISKDFNINSNLSENKSIIINEKSAISKYSNSDCFIHKNAFCNSLAKIFIFNNKKYKWFSFFDKTSGMEEYVANDDIHILLQKSSTEIFDDFLSGHYYKVTKLKWLNQDSIPILSNHFISEFLISKTTQSLHPNHFSYCYELTTIEFDNGIKIKKIPKNCFAYTSLKKITIPESVFIIEKSAFFSCNELEEISFSNSNLQLIKENAFCKCEKLIKINIPSKLKIISKNCFAFSGLKMIKIPDSVEIIDSMAFYNCKGLSEIILNDGLIEICDLSFAYNVSLKSIDLPNTLVKIKEKAFYNCSNLKKVNTMEKTQLIEIYDGSFGCTQIEELCINRMATKLFEPVNLPNLNKITFYNGKPTNFIQLEDGTIYNKYEKYNNENQKLDISKLEEQMTNDLHKKAILSNRYCCIQYFRLESIIYSMNFSENDDDYIKILFNILLERNRSRFSNNDELKNNPILNLLFVPKNLKTLKIHEDCFSISNSVIERLSNLSTIEYLQGSTNFICNFPNYDHHLSITLNRIKILGDYSYIEEGVFAHFKSLEFVEFGPNTNISIIQKHAFLDCKKLQRISIPSSCISIEEGAFKDCISLSSVQFGTNKSSPKMKYIRKEAFYNCCSLESIEIPLSVIIICESAFMNCRKLQNIKIFSDDENGLELIGKNAFKNCTSLKSFYLPPSCVIIGPSSFMNCTSLEKIECKCINLASIQCRAFFNCSSLKCFELKNLELKKLHDFYTLKYGYNDKDIDTWSYYSNFCIGAEAFMNCDSLTEVVIEDNLKEIDTIEIDSEGELLFKYPPKLNKCLKLRIDEFIKKYPFNQTIQRGAFYNCKSLSRIRLFLGNLEHIYEKAFMNCSSLKVIEINSIYSRYLVSNSLDLNAFIGTLKDLIINLFNCNKCVKTINIITTKLPINRRRIFKHHISSLNKSLITYQIPDEKNNEINGKTKIKSTCLSLFDSPRISFRNRVGSLFISKDEFRIYIHHGMIALDSFCKPKDKH